MSAPQATPCPECSQHPGRVPYHDIDGNFADWVQCRCAAPAAEPDNLVARLREMRTVYMSPASADSRTLAEAADRIEALEADAHSFGDRLADATEARDAALTKVTELEAENQRFAEYLDAISENYDRMERERDAALARANEAERWMRHTSECAAKRPIGGDCGCGLNDWLRRSQEAE